MSGGSFDYLCFEELPQLISDFRQLQRMSDTLAELGYADDAARETEELILFLRQLKNRAEIRINRLNGVWKAVEWWKSYDTSEESVHKALAEYRKEIEDEKK